MGKSRLVQELSAAIDRDPDLIRWRQGRSLPYGQGVSFWALGEMVKAESGILESDVADVAEAKLREVVAARLRRTRCRLDRLDFATADRNRRGHLGFRPARRNLRRLAPVRRRARRRTAERARLRRPALGRRGVARLRRRPRRLGDRCAAPRRRDRTAGTARAPARWGGGKPNATTLSLAPLSESETAELVHAVLERAVLPADVQAAVLARAGGNPLYAEEFARLVASEARPRGRPAGTRPLQGLIAARLDALTRGEKELLQDAAVLGKVFWLGALTDGRAANELDDALRTLERKEFVRRERRSSVEGEEQYAFRHVLVRDVAYAQIPRAARAERHRRAAAWIEAASEPRTQPIYSPTTT